MAYNQWPNGLIPENLQRPELNQIKQNGYRFDDAREVIDIFEKKIAQFGGSAYAITTDCCTHALELSLRWQLHKGEIGLDDEIILPAHTYVSVYWMLKQIGFSDVRLIDINWYGKYLINGTNVYDAATQWKRSMFKSGYHCISFQIKKKICIGRGGAILTNSKEACEWLKLARYDGRDINIPYDMDGHIKSQGFHYYMTPEDAARGILLMDEIKEETDGQDYNNYPDVRKMIQNI